MIFVISLSILFLDQFSKIIVSKNLSLNQSVPLIRGVFHLTLIHNRGAAFGMLRNQAQLFILTTVLAIIFILITLKKNKGKKRPIYNISLSCILGGALGNFIDRLTSGYVIDFLDFRIWPVFNVADSAITVGAILLGWALLKTKN
ncbi:MAG: signal peptidase II [Candidatus Omnitrophica bacterium]|nr:signal peptidase II [Candidatus Omnitrophota bacterium]MDD5593045.1 signal peptidase II [Candidatus Omnitrophota bacterium]